LLVGAVSAVDHGKAPCRQEQNHPKKTGSLRITDAEISKRLMVIWILLKQIAEKGA